MYAVMIHFINATGYVLKLKQHDFRYAAFRKHSTILKLW